MGQQDCERAHSSDITIKSMAAGESVPAQRAIMAPWVSAAPETMAAEVKLRSAVDP